MTLWSYITVEYLLLLVLALVPLALVWRVFRGGPSAAARDPRSFAKQPFDSRHDNRFSTLFVNAFRLRCPVCKQGKIFPHWLRVAERCPHCHVKLERGPGFYLGSIYFNYGATGILEFSLYFILVLGFGWPSPLVLGLLVFIGIVFPLFFLRYARASFLVFDQFFQPRLPPTKEELEAEENAQLALENQRLPASADGEHS